MGFMNSHAWTELPWSKAEEKAAALATAQRSKHPHPAFARMKAEAKKRGWPRAFEADLFIHDASNLLRKASSEPFVWAVGETGTFLYKLDPKTPMTASQGESLVESFVEAISADRPALFYWDGLALLESTKEQIVHVLSGRSWRWGDDE